MIYLQVEKNGEKFEIQDANTFFKKFRGFMFKKNISNGIFFKENSVHMLFMREPIDIIMLNNKSKIIKLYPAASPWTFFRIIPKCKLIIELPKGSIEKGKIEKDSNLYFRIDKKTP